ncbi:TonB-dependent receptor domain-containing protein [Enterovibrio norvegicus]|uniref:Vitamin B12 transporter BtuB n=1 Tax=Enterovibrio norvegicus TaxID=188144 RepID=A0A2N7L7H0_9GAMM|nr:TonB-dependent receptor [Enterovibrio norvegicus]PMN90065.1 ligand-gated channel [Enterovibrio norvegicus]
MSHKYWVAGMLPMAVFAHAETNTPSIDDTMVVTASRFEQPVKDVIAPINVVTRDQIEQSQAKTMTEVLRKMPGVEVTVNGGIGQQASIFIRGTNSTHALVLIDGVRMNQSLSSGTSINRIPLNQVERIELIRGSGAAVYGSDAIGGVLNIITRSERGSETKSITVGAGSNEYREGNFVASSDISENGHLKIAAGFQETDGFNVNPQLGQNDGDKHGFNGNQLMINYEHLLSENWTAFASVRWFDNDAEYNRYDSFNGPGYVVANGNSESTVYTLRTDFVSEQLASSWTFSHQESANTDTQPSVDTPFSLLDIDLTTFQWANRLTLSESFSLLAGADWRREKMNGNSRDTAFDASFTPSIVTHPFAGEDREIYGVYGSANYEIGDLQLQASARHDRYDSSYESAESFDDYTTWSLGAGYRIGDEHRVTASVGTAFKAPTFSDLDSNLFLEPEESLNLELGISGFYSAFYWQLAFYDNDVDNLIYYIKENQFSGNSYNVDARIRGVELETGFSTGPVSHTVVLEYKDHEDSKGIQLARRAKENAKWLMEYGINDFDFSLSYLYTGKRMDLPSLAPTEDDYLAAYSLWDFGVTYWATPEVALRGRVDNLFDETYETTGGYPAPERAYYVSMDYRF